MRAKQRALNERTTLTALMVEGLATRIGRAEEARLLPVCTAGGGLCTGRHWDRLAECGSPEGRHT